MQTERPYMTYYICVSYNFDYMLHQLWDKTAWKVCDLGLSKLDGSDIENNL